MLDDEGYLNSLLPTIIVPSTTTHLGTILETLLVPWNLQSLVETILNVNSGDTLIPPDRYILQVTWLQHIHS